MASPDSTATQLVSCFLCFVLEELRFPYWDSSEVYQGSLQVGFRLGLEMFVWLRLEFGGQ